MREILFRGKQISTGKWVTGGIMKTFHPNFAHENEKAFLQKVPNCYCICSGGKDIFVEQESIGQFTGLTDKNGKRIFEGDIVIFNRSRNLPNTFPRPQIIFFDERNAQFTRYASPYATLQKDMMGECEVIGNIYDNYELLEGDNV